MKHRLTFLLLAAAGPASAAVVDVPPPWVRWDPANGENNQYAIYARWEFAADTNPVGPDNEATIDINPLHCTLCPNEAAFPSGATWSPGDGSGQWNFSAQGQIDGSLANVIDNFPRKEVQAAITWFGQETNAPKFYITNASDSSINGIIPIDGGSVDNYNRDGIHTLISAGDPNDPNDDQWVSIYNSRITPNPDNENFQISMFGGTAIDGLIIDTISIPEPGNAILIGLLCSSGFFLRGRRS